MTAPCGGCADGNYSLELVRDGTSKNERAGAAPDPALVRVDERRPEHAMVFAAAYARYLRYVDPDGAADGDWQMFFEADLSARLAVAAIEDVAQYRTTVKSLLRELEDPELPPSEEQMAASLTAVFDCIGTLAKQLDTMATSLPAGHPLRATMDNLIRSQLSPMLRRLIGYYKAGEGLNIIDAGAPPPADVVILGQAASSFGLAMASGLSAAEWPAGVGADGWAAYVTFSDLTQYTGAFGTGTTAVEQINHLATHNLFRAACETFLGGFAKVVDQARLAVEASFTEQGHEPHYALFMAFLKLLDHARDSANTLTAKHLDFYYRQVLGLRERPARPSQAHVLVQLTKHVDTHLIARGSLLRAGKDAAGADIHFAVDHDLVANKATVAELRRVYRHPATKPLPADHGRIFARPAVDPDQPWHPFAEEVFADGQLQAIDMPPAEIGFAIASHHLWMAEGVRTVDIGFDLGPQLNFLGKQVPMKARCRLTSTKGWIEKEVISLTVREGRLHLTVGLDGNDPPVTPYDAAVHGYTFATTLPMLLVQLVNEAGAPWDYPALEGFDVHGVTLVVGVQGLKTFVLSNDHGPVDGSQPFLAFGSTPRAGSSLVIGSHEVFQKAPTSVAVDVTWMPGVAAHGDLPKVSGDVLSQGTWKDTGPQQQGISTTHYTFGEVSGALSDAPDLTPDEPYSTAARTGFVRLRLSGGFGTDTYPVELARYIAKLRTDKPTAPVLPMAESLTLGYSSVQHLDLSAPTEGGGEFFHMTPFGHAQQTIADDRTTVPLLPRFRVGAELAEGTLYLGVSDLRPPQNLALLFQVVDGSANPLAVKPDDHVSWSYLRGNEWESFDADAVADGTDGLLASGIVTVSVPADADTDHTVLPTGLHWIRLAVASGSDAVCRLLTVQAQASGVTQASAAALALPPGTISKLDQPDAAVKGIAQPFPTFGGRPPETTLAFATRVSERLRHKDRAIALWDHEHLVLEAFPSIYQVRCLNHTRYEPSSCGAGIYRELAPGHVTIVTIPDLALPNPRDPLRPFTSLRVLGEIERFLSARMSCFARLHVRNPQFEEVRVDLRVRLREGVDETFHVNQLKREITEFLSPWAYRGDARPTFHGKVHKSVVVNFVEERPYVDYVTDVRLFHRLPGAADGPDLDEVVGSRAISILVSAPPDDHGVHVIHSDEERTSEECSCSTGVD